MKYKYKLVENEDEVSSRGKNIDLPKNIIVTSDDINKVISALENPNKENFKGIHMVYSKDIKDIKLNVYGDKNIMPKIKINQELKKQQIETYGKLFYQYIEDFLNNKGEVVKFDRILNKKTDKIGKGDGFLLELPLQTASNNKIIDKYMELDKKDNQVKTGLKWEQNGNKLIFLNSKNLPKNITTKIIKAALGNNIEYKLGEEDENEKKNENLLKSIIKEQLKKLINKK